MKRLAVVALLLLSQLSFAGGPLYVAGVSTFQPGLAGTPITWANGNVLYYTDQGDLSPLLPSTTADQFVADAFSRWTSIPTAALTATRAGSLNEDVNGSNVTQIQGAVSWPADLSASSGRPMAVIYDADGKVFDALLGAGAGSADLCDTNSIYTVVDSIGPDAHFVHAMIILNGNCAKSSSDLPILKYRLVRALGQALGLDYSQLNENVVTGAPGPSLDDYAGFPVMHPIAALCNRYGCQSDADQPRMDDRAALSRLYPVTGANITTGKQLFRDNTVRVYGTIRFPAWKGSLGQGMQGVNVVARLVDPATSRVSHRSTASSVSGFLFRGEAGNSITGFYDVLGARLDRFGSNDPALEGFYDLSGLDVPAGYPSATYEISIESVNPTYVDSTSIGPYKQGQVAPSGTFSAVRVTIPRGGEVAQDISMQKAASQAVDQYEPHSFLFPVSAPASGTWAANISGYGDLDYLYFSAAANRTFTFDVTALNESGQPSTSKLQPVLGVWTSADAEDSPQLFESYFNSPNLATTRIQGTTTGTGVYKLGIADARGDGRPDFQYQARLLYADGIAPSRADVRGGTTITLTGIGFSNAMQLTIGSAPVIAAVASPSRIVFQSPQLPDGAYTIALRDTSNGASAQIDNALLVGAADARLTLVSGGNPQVPVGTQAPNPMRVQVVDSNTGEPVGGATVIFNAPPSAAIAGCDHLPCSVVSDQNGGASAYILVKAEGSSLITAALPNGASTSTTVNGVLSALEITVANPNLNVSAGATASLPVTATVVANGVPVANRAVNFLLNAGSATISPGTVLTNSQGNASTSVAVNGVGSDVNISACVAPNNAPCRTLIVHPVQSASLSLQRISGDQQTVAVGGSFAPVTVRVVDAFGNSVSGVPITCVIEVYRAASDSVRIQQGEVITSSRDETVVLSSSLQTAVSDASGLLAITPSVAQSQPVQVVLRVLAGKSELDVTLQSVWSQSLAAPVPGSARGGATSSGTNPPIHLLLCTKAGCSAASTPSVLRRGNTASSKARSASADR